MTQLVVRKLPVEVKERLRLRAGRHGRSLEAEVRDILVRAAEDEGRSASLGLGSRIAALFADLGPGEADIAEVRTPTRAADFGE